MNGALRARALHRATVAAATLTAALALPGCGYSIVRHNDLRVQKLLADSVAIATLETQIAAWRAQCRADSVRAAGERAALERAFAGRATTATAASDSTLRARDAEVAALRDQLAKANAELDRIRRRLSTGRP